MMKIENMILWKKLLLKVSLIIDISLIQKKYEIIQIMIQKMVSQNYQIYLSKKYQIHNSNTI